ncbi:MAG TPA: Gfo/Idh/MocA family oxidoreductase [Chloroflexota bacterium]|nr:Gfo/Idh/MocA family oxidoreductase [Chloroflexota bacterium]
MPRLRVGIIGTGRRKERADARGYGMAYDHAAAYQALPDACALVACADIVRENAAAFAHAMGIPAEGVFTDYRAMLAEAHLDVVSICTWPHLHAPMTIDCARAGVRAVHCEKPMADSWGAARLMAQECARRGVQLTFNHQRRFGAPFSAARDLLESGAIGDLVRVEVSCDNVYDWGTHYLDMCGFYTGDQPAEWVIGQIDYRTEQRIFGAHVENHAVGSWRYHGGVFGLIATGSVAGLIGVDNRLIGTEGVVEVGVPDGPTLRVRRVGSREWESVDTGDETVHGPGFFERAIADVIDALTSGREPELSARRALNATEIIFAIYESSRRRGRVDLPLTISDHPLGAMVDAGDLQVSPAL